MLADPYQIDCCEGEKCASLNGSQSSVIFEWQLVYYGADCHWIAVMSGHEERQEDEVEFLQAVFPNPGDCVDLRQKDTWKVSEAV